MERKSPFQVYLNSSDFSDRYLENSTTKFLTTLAEPIILKDLKKWTVCLKSIYFSNNFVDANQYFVKVHTSILEPRSGVGNVLGVCTRVDPQESDFVFYEPENSEEFLLANSYINEIDIALKDKDDKQLSFAYGEPTIVVLEFRKMETPKREFIVRVDSSKDPNGDARAFSAVLPPSLSLDPEIKWSVSLNSIIYNGNFEQVPPFIEEPHWIVKFHNEVTNEDVELKAPLSINKFITPGKLRGYLQTLAKREFNYRPDFTDVFVRAIRGVRYWAVENKLKFESGVTGQVLFPYNWALMLGSTKQPDSQGYVSYEIQANKEFEFENSVNLDVWVPHFMFIYSNAIEYSPVGHVLAPILRVVPIKQSTMNNYYRSYEAKSDEFHRLVFSQIQNLRFELRSVDGRPISFRDKNQNIILSLKFIQQ